MTPLLDFHERLFPSSTPYMDALSAQPHCRRDNASTDNSYSDFSSEDDEGPFIIAPAPTPDIPELEFYPRARRITIALRPPTPGPWSEEEECTEDADATLVDGPYTPLKGEDEDKDEAQGKVDVDAEEEGASENGDEEVDESEEDESEEESEVDSDDDDSDAPDPQAPIIYRTRIPMGQVPFITTYRSQTPLSDVFGRLRRIASRPLSHFAKVQRSSLHREKTRLRDAFHVR